MKSLLVLLFLGGVSSQFYDTYTGLPTSPERVEQLRAQNMLLVCAVEVKPCTPHEPRRLSGSCNNPLHPSRGAGFTPYRRMLPAVFSAGGGLRTASSGRELPNARTLRVGLISDARKANKKFTQMIPNVGLLITGDSTSVHDTINYAVATQTCCQPGGEADPRCMPISVAEDDLYLRNTGVRCLNLTRAITYQTIGCVPKSLPSERVNSVEPMLDLSILYGNLEDRAMDFREMSGGRLKMEEEGGRLWPISFKTPVNPCLLNRPPNETRCHDSAFPTTNGLIGGNLMFLLYFRQHNALARKLEALNPCWDDDKLFYTTREIVIAMANEMIYYEWAPIVLGYEHLVHNKVIIPGALHVNDYDPHLEPGVFLEFIMGIRWFHTLQDGRGNLYNKDGKLFGMIPVVDLTLRTGVLPLNNTIEGLTQGSFRQPCAYGHFTVDPDMSERVLSSLQVASDVLASDIMKGRDMGLPPYNEYRKYCKLPVAKSFKDLYQWMGTEQVETIARLYETVDDVDVMTGILAEKAAPDALVGPVLQCIMTEQLLAWRRADRFWYEGTVHPYAHTPDQLQAIRKTSMAKVLCDHGDSVTAVQPNPFVLPGPGNEITDCKYYKDMDLEPWRDSCQVKKDPSPSQFQEIKYDYNWY